MYSIYKHDYDDEEAPCWYLSAIPIGEVPGGDNDYIFYYNVGKNFSGNTMEEGSWLWN